MSWGVDDEENEPEEEPEEVGEETNDSGGWGSDVQDVDEESERDETYNEQFVRLVDEENVDQLIVSNIEENYKKISDADALEEALEQDDRSSAREIYKRRLSQLEDDMGNSDEPSQKEEDKTSSSTAQEETEQNEPSEKASESKQRSGQEVQEVDSEELDEMGVENLAEEGEGDTSDETEEPQTTQVSSLDEDTEEISNVDIGDVAPHAMNTDEAADQPYLWRILGWAEPGKGKTHFGFTMPQPVCIIDTEGKAHNLASKFDDKVTYIWQPDDYDQAREALDEAISVLHRYLEEGHRGTLVVDSMSEMWEWSKQKYVSKVYDGKSLDEVNLSSNMGQKGESDWKVIKRYHNKRFREVMVDTPFHLYWTAMQTDDYEAIMEGDQGNPKKPVGERDNGYKVDQVLRFAEGPDGTPHGQLQKSGSISKYGYAGLKWPTFPKHKEICERLRKLEEEGKDPMLEDFDGVKIIEGDPGRWDDD